MKPNSGRRPSAASARSALTMSKAISGRMHLEGELHAGPFELIENRVPLRGEVGEAVLDLRVADGREAVEQRPDLRAGEAVDHADAEVLRGVGGANHFLGGALLHLGGLAVTPHVLGQDGLVPLVDRVANGLADEMVGDGPGLETVLGQQRVAAVAVGLVLRRDDVEVIAPAGELEAVITEGFRLGGEGVERQVGPLAGEEGNGTWHVSP